MANMADHFKIRHTRIELGGQQAAARAAGADSFTIGDLAREFGISLRTLRFYEDRGLITPRREGTARVYGPLEKARLDVILKAKRLGFTLTAIRGMLEREAPAAPGAAALPLSLAQIDKQIAYLESERSQIEQALRELRSQRDALSA